MTIQDIESILEKYVLIGEEMEDYIPMSSIHAIAVELAREFVKGVAE